MYNDEPHQFIAQMQMPTHTAHIHYDQDRGIIRVFKYRQGQCDFDVFTSDSIDEVADYITEKFQDFGYCFQEDPSE